jgi:hypothetical protein
MNGNANRNAVAVEVGIEGNCSRVTLACEFVTDARKQLVVQWVFQSKDFDGTKTSYSYA